MSNPARELHSLYSAWRETLAEKPRQARTLLTPITPSGSPQMMKAFRLLARIDDLLRALAHEGHSVAVYQRQFPGWSAPVLAYPHGWTTNVEADGLAPVAVLDQIEAFASFLDGKVFTISDSQTSNLRGVLDQARGLLESDDSLDENLRFYIHRLLQSIQEALDDNAVGLGFDTAEAARRLWVALRAAEGASAERASAWRSIWTQLVAGVTGGALVRGGEIVIQAIAAAE